MTDKQEQTTLQADLSSELLSRAGEHMARASERVHRANKEMLDAYAEAARTYAQVRMGPQKEPEASKDTLCTAAKLAQATRLLHRCLPFIRRNLPAKASATGRPSKQDQRDAELIAIEMENHFPLDPRQQKGE